MEEKQYKDGTYLTQKGSQLIAKLLAAKGHGAAQPIITSLISGRWRTLIRKQGSCHTLKSR